MRNMDGRNWRSVLGCATLPSMTISSLRIVKSETRNFAERDRVKLARFQTADEPAEWSMSNGSFFAAFVVILAVLALIALVAR